MKQQRPRLVPGVLVPIVLALVWAASACHKDAAPSTPAAPSVPLMTETFNGTVSVKSADSHNFSVSQTGSVNVTLTTAGPPPTVVMGVGIGLPKDSACTLITGASTNTAAGSSTQLAGTVTAGTLCVQVYDVGNQTVPVSYTVTVAHP